jgi:hypothetical protein
LRLRIAENGGVEGRKRGPGGVEIRYARNGGVRIAYQVVGEGDVDLVYIPDYISNLIEFTDRGTHELKGIPGKWQLFAVAQTAQ